MAEHVTKQEEVEEKPPVEEPVTTPHAAHPHRPLTGTVIGIIIAVLLLLLVGSFGAGLALGHLGGSRGGFTNPGGFGSQYGPGGGFNGGNGGYSRRGVNAGVTGSVTAISSSSITVKSGSGELITYAISSSTTVTNNGASASVGDIKVGDIVRVRPTNDQTGDASTIQINS